MLYNPDWRRERPETKYPRFMRWLDKQPALSTYDYGNCRKCPYARYLRSYGIFGSIVSCTSWWGLWLGFCPLFGGVPSEINDALLRWPRTYGALQQRLKA